MVAADVSVRVGWPADAAGIAEVQLRSWRSRYDGRLAAQLDEQGIGVDDLAEAWRSTLARPPQARQRALVALVRDTVVGFALTGPNTDPDADPSADGEIGELTIDPDTTRAGHGSRLLQACVDTLLADRFARAVVWVDATDDVLRAFLTSTGWAPDGASRELADETGAALKQVRLHTALS
ncbi:MULTISPECIES: GNAT family N-acetyltransferase [unclassified Nocardioides]|uniref:GNAT family N-acetyltransferase n=1 Tax=unclassified Nocardioides TaxID=2615069 RepID=UPI000702DCB3|nr:MULTISPECIES: GNAT family N-acetyltransferase [unclassified Nocardioides]KRC56777.1 GCN5 family acetyltransferase [Nocardioides sp. Root79]KRC76987.1 GCN5 family acetyltransferase [Nocardioides sp. Root240]